MHRGHHNVNLALLALPLAALSLACGASRGVPAPSSGSHATASAPVCSHPEIVSFALGRELAVHQPALYPETLVLSASRDAFLLSSMREGGVFAVDGQGDAKPLIRDERLSSVLGITLDRARNRLWLVNSDIGASAHPSAAGQKQLAAVGSYDLTTGAALHYVDVAQLHAGPHLLNGIALDASGSVYVTDSFSPVIYKVDAQGQASVLVEDPRFAGEGINLNGIVVHPDGYLLVVKKSDGALFKVPLANPAALAKVELGRSFEGGDGLLLLPGGRGLVIIANKVPALASNAAFALASADGWVTASLSAEMPLGDVYPTTAELRDDKLYVLHSKLNELIQAAPEQKALLQREAAIREIGTVRCAVAAAP